MLLAPGDSFMHADSLGKECKKGVVNVEEGNVNYFNYINMIIWQPPGNVLCIIRSR